VVVLGGPSGSGKSTLIASLVAKPGFRLAVSATTRPPRSQEQDGVDYHFVSESGFADLRADGKLLEWAQVHTDWYGTPSSELEARGDDDRFLLLDIDEQGLRSLQELEIKRVSIFIAPPSMEELERRLRGRHSESEEELQLRLQNATRTMAAQDRYEHVVVNHRIETSLDEIRRILGLPGDADTRRGNQACTGTRI